MFSLHLNNFCKMWNIGATTVTTTTTTSALNQIRIESWLFISYFKSLLLLLLSTLIICCCVVAVVVAVVVVVVDCIFKAISSKLFFIRSFEGKNSRHSKHLFETIKDKSSLELSLQHHNYRNQVFSIWNLSGT